MSTHSYRADLVKRLREQQVDGGSVGDPIMDAALTGMVALFHEAAAELERECGPSLRWIPVGEQTPEMNWVFVLAYSPKPTQQGESVWVAVGDAFRSQDWMEAYGVTHWMPLPTKPLDATKCEVSKEGR